ncbi:FAD/FMN-containing dehydrogenase [Rhodopseudomonas julia]|uniref:FAD/FMN-containing dehydrogenase n=1 Tax=Rhodopseudomonas julia TaxID=200617 RepID=A0ABU0C2N5_9BRAD|nr:FAD-binding oxidoreductase [Rhodopseudomonas julia]MDQ0324777.1 FAD/FMN-containing dehydrogenase [Rhodopseudomonas julia]
MNDNPTQQTIVSTLSAIVGETHVLTSPEETRPYCVEWRDLYFGVPAAVVRPASSEEVAAILRFANETGVSIVPQGGNTGLVGAQVPDESGREVVLTLERLKAIRDVDREGATLVAEAGVVLEEIQKAASEAGLFFPLSLGAQGSCRIGGNIATNAGGTGVLAYGNTRDLVLGLEVVMADGTIWNGLRRLRKDNTGYDLKQLFIGSEGTLGVITAASLRLFPAPKGRAVAFLAVEDPQTALTLFRRFSQTAGSALTGFELMPRLGIDFVLRHQEGTRDPLETPYPWYCLVEISSGRSEAEASELMETTLEAAFEAEEVLDGAPAASLAQAAEFWHIRHTMSEVQKKEGGSIKHDVSVPVAKIPEFLRRASAAVTEAVPGARPLPFGHLGDGNIHYNVSQPVGADRDEFLARWDEVNKIVHGIVGELSGSISAEHGIGRLKRKLLVEVKSEIEIDLMRRIKNAFDPNGIMNPGRML